MQFDPTSLICTVIDADLELVARRFKFALLAFIPNAVGVLLLVPFHSTALAELIPSALSPLVRGAFVKGSPPIIAVPLPPFGADDQRTQPVR
jgi:hypothetical protein